jgi:hypothetical protein
VAALALRSAVPMIVSVLVLLVFRAAAHADAASALRCRQTIDKELTKLTKTKSSILRKCRRAP